jgi:hypothetical protein
LVVADASGCEVDGTAGEVALEARLVSTGESPEILPHVMCR